MSELLLELFSEEIPAMMQKGAEKGFYDLFSKIFTESNITFSELKIYTGTRRIVVEAGGLPASVNIPAAELKGPRVGAPDTAITGFCRSNNITAADLRVISIKNQNFHAYIKPAEQKPIREILAEILPRAIGSYVWPKSMYWGTYNISWVRPLKNILCILDNEILPIKYGHLEANNITYGHRFLAKADSIIVNSIEDYKQKLKDNYVILDQHERRDLIWEQLTAKLSELRNYKILDESGRPGKLEIQDKDNKKDTFSLTEDNKLLDEITGLVDWPTAMMGKIDGKFLSLPPEVLRASMRTHQKYFFVTNTKMTKGYFLFVSNMGTSEDSKAVIVKGNEKVLSARLSDALYFYQQDMAEGALGKRLEKLKSVVFHAKLGNLHQKCERIKNIVNYFDYEKVCNPLLLLDGIMFCHGEGYISGQQQYEKDILPKLLNTAGMCKNDIASEMVGEFPELQGIMGYYYDKAKGASGETKGVTGGTRFSEAIRDHYKPLGPHDNLPVGPAAILAIADKMDSIVGLILAGEHPTGSGDPYALRRQALGIIRIILESRWKSYNPAISLKFKDLVEFCVKQYKKQQRKLIDSQSLGSAGKLIMSFLEDRARYYLKDKYDTRVINAVLDFDKESDLLAIESALIALDKLVRSENGQLLISLYKRAKNILIGQNPKGKATEIRYEPARDISEDYDNNLFRCLSSVREKIDKPLSEGKLEQALGFLSEFTNPITNFFDNVLVMDDANPDLKNNRLCLLREITELFEKVARFDLL